MNNDYQVPKCGRCGSECILMDAYAYWCTDDQEWKLFETYEDAVCNDCGEINNWSMITNDEK